MATNKIMNICRSKMKESKSTFIWEIDHFPDRLYNQYLESGIFSSTSSSGHLMKWSLRITLPQQNYEYVYHHDGVPISINLVDTAATEISAKIKFMIRNSIGEDVERFTIPNRIFTKGQYYYPSPMVSHLITYGELFDKKNGFLPSDRLTIVLEITNLESMMEMEYGIVDKSEVPENTDMSFLFEQGLFTDCELVAKDGNKFQVNKCILASKSPVFLAMFDHQMIEATEGIANIKDIKSEVLEQLVKYIYSGTSPPKLGEMAAELLEAADKYQLNRLKMLCERELVKSMGNENVCALIVLANQHSAKNLQTYAIKYLQMNAKEVMKSDGWKQLIEGNNHAELINQIFKEIFE